MYVGPQQQFMLTPTPVDKTGKHVDTRRQVKVYFPDFTALQFPPGPLVMDGENSARCQRRPLESKGQRWMVGTH